MSGLVISNESRYGVMCVNKTYTIVRSPWGNDMYPEDNYEQLRYHLFELEHFAIPYTTEVLQPPC